MKLLECENLSIAYRRAPAIVEGLSLSLSAGAFVALLGPNGSGKSSLLRTLAGLQPPAEGRVILEGEPIYGMGAMTPGRRARGLAVVLTDPILPGLLTGRDIVAAGRLPHRPLFGPLDPESRQVIAESLSLVEATHLAERRVSEVSDGERQRLMLARALAQRPRVLLLDEPGAFLDPPHQAELFILLTELLASRIIEAVVLATHQLSLALDYADTLWLLSNRSVEETAPKRAKDAIDRAFAHEGVRFNPQRGTFIRD